MTDHDPETPPPSAVIFAPDVWIRKRDLRFSFSRSGGPGGQAVNKLSTRAELRLDVTAIRGLDEFAQRRLRKLAGQRLTLGDELVLHCDTYRSQLDNRRTCVERLTELVVEALKRPRKRRRTKPSRAMIERRLAAKKRAGEKKSRRKWRGED